MIHKEWIDVNEGNINSSEGILIYSYLYNQELNMKNIMIRRISPDVLTDAEMGQIFSIEDILEESIWDSIKELKAEVLYKSGDIILVKSTLSTTDKYGKKTILGDEHYIVKNYSNN